jgi:hypothetical protein
MKLPELKQQSQTSDNNLQFSHIDLDDKYIKEWNVHNSDFLILSKNGEPIRNTLYRKGGLSNIKLGVDKYFVILKYSEDIYSKEFMAKIKGHSSEGAKHLKSSWVIIDSFGNEKIEVKDSLDYPYVIDGSCVYSIGNRYYNIETGELYCRTSKVMNSSDFLFLDNQFDDDKSKRGVMKIDLKTGLSELFL